MSGLQRKGTVSKSSGPVHVNSYALKGVPIKYTPPFFLPDQLTLPPSWAPPTLPSDDIFRYDYSKERQVLEQARVRTMSLAAEAQAREKREQEEEKKRRIEAAAAAERAKVTSSSNTLPPPLIPSPGSAILTPKPASQPQTAPLTNGIDSAPASKDPTADVPIGDSSKLIKPLGEMSLTEFEGDNFNPFDSASLQAINDMEILQTISLLPIPENSTLPPQTSTSSTQISSHSGSATSQGQTVVTDSRPPAAIAAGRVPLNSGSVANGPAQLNFSGPQPLTAPSRPALPVSSVASTNRPSISPHLASPSSGVVQQAQSVPLPNPSLSPHPILPPIGTNITHSHSEPANTSTVHPVPLPPPSSQPANPLPPISLPSTLPMFPPSPQGTNSPLTITPSLPPSSSNSPNPPPTSSPSSSQSVGIISADPPPSHPIPLPRTSLAPYPPLPQPSSQPLPPQATVLSTSPSGTTPGLPPPQQSSAVGQAANNDGVCTLIDFRDAATTPLTTQQVSPAQKPPVPKPRSFPVTGQQVSNSTFLPYPTGPTPYPRPPVVGPSPHPPAVAPKPSPVGSTVQARANSIMASMPQGQPAIGRPGLGVPVLPPINPSNPLQPASSRGQSSLPPSTSAFSPHTFPTPQLPPPYPQPSPAPARSITPPPPYFPSQDQPSRRYSQPLPQSVPSHYTLPDIQASLSAEEKREVESIAGMGFPAPRVARAVKKFNSDRTKVLDFLILVGNVEESSGSRGDSAETALTVCSEDDIKAKRYLQKVTYYRESGFSEKNIHEAYEKAGMDWDRALDILTQDTT